MNSAKGRIVVGVDGSDASIDAIRWAVGQAQLTGDELEAITTWQVVSEFAELAAEKIDWEARARSQLDEAIAKVENTADVQIKRITAQGHPASILTDASTNADLLVVGSRGHGGFVGMVLGSVSAHVSASAHCPVVVVRH